ncbi:hypothetical protein BDBG_18090, partial [Blastomyces gilchristii SLH14081]
SSHIDRFTSVNDYDFNVESLIENLKNIIIKELSVLYVTESSASLSALSVSFSVTLSQSSTPVTVSDSLTFTTSIPAISTSATSALSDSAVSAFIISSPCFKKMLYRLNKSCFSAKDIHVFRNRNTDVILFYTHRFASVSEIILIEDDNAVKTILSHSQASFITFSLFSVRKIVHILSY